jgi:fibronectin type 3 domain-containing protein
MLLGGYDRTGVSAKAVAAVSEVTLKSAKDSGSCGITITWYKEAKADGYQIYRKTSGGSWKMIGTSASTATSYTDNTGAIGTTYIYTVRAYRDINGSHVLGEYDRTGVSATLVPATVKLSSATASSGKKITVRWSKVSNCTGYVVYRKTGSGSWSRIATISGNSTTSYTDTTGKAGTTYTYTVRAYKTVNSKEVLGDYNRTGVKATCKK